MSKQSAATLAASRARKRALIESAGEQFASVSFIKRDGTERLMLVKPASTGRNVKGEAGCPSARQGAATRAVLYPELLPIWDAAKKAFRSINLDTVHRIKVGGETFDVGS